MKSHNPPCILMAEINICHVCYHTACAAPLEQGKRLPQFNHQPRWLKTLNGLRTTAAECPIKKHISQRTVLVQHPISPDSSFTRYTHTAQLPTDVLSELQHAPWRCSGTAPGTLGTHGTLAAPEGVLASLPISHVETKVSRKDTQPSLLLKFISYC
jgi:hypothetical protein